jgi:hypothetical protein
VLDPQGTRGIQEASITDGRGRPVHGSRVMVGPRVDLHYRPDSRTRMNLEVDLDPREQQRHRDEHLAAMRLAYNRWVKNGKRGPNPLAGVASIFASALRPTRRGSVGRITSVERIQYHAGKDGIVRRVTTGCVSLPTDGVLPQAVARQHQRIFTTVPTDRTGRPVRFRPGPPQLRRSVGRADLVNERLVQQGRRRTGRTAISPRGVVRRPARLTRGAAAARPRRRIQRFDVFDDFLDVVAL